MAERSNFSKEKRKKNKQDSELASIDFSSSVEKDFWNKNMQIGKKRKIADSKMVKKGYTMQTRSQSRQKKVFGNKNMSMRKLVEKKLTVKTRSHSRRKVADLNEEKRGITVLEDEVVCPEDSTNVKANVPELVVTRSAEVNMECTTTIFEMESIYNEEVTDENEEKNVAAVLEDEVACPENSANEKVKLAELVVAHSAEVDRECSKTILEMEAISNKDVTDENEEKNDITVLEEEVACPDDSTNVKFKLAELVVAHSAEVDRECPMTILEMEAISNKEEASGTKEEILKSVLLEKVFSSKHSSEVRIEFPRVGVSPTPEVDMEDSMEAHESRKEYSEYVLQDKNLASEDSRKVEAKLLLLAVGPTSKVDLEFQPEILEMECKSNEEIAIEPSKSDVKEKDHGHNEGDKSGSYLVSSDDQEMLRQFQKEN